MSSTKTHDDSQISRFCWQNLQVDPAPDFPDAELLRDEGVQEAIYKHVFSDEIPLRPPPRYQVRILKELISRIEASIEDWDLHGISDNLTFALSRLLSDALPSETDAAQRRDNVVYHLSLLQAQPTVQSSPHINLLESRSLISASGTTGLRTWEAALHLGQYLCVDPSSVKNKRVLELGAGTGYLAVLCAKYLGSSHVIASDGSDEVVNHLADSFFLNGLQGSPQATTMQLQWGHTLVGTELDGVFGKVDTVLGADITYDVSVIPALVATLEDLATLFRGLSVLIAATERNRATFERFLEVCRNRGFRVTHESFPVPPRHEQNGPFYSDATPIHICKLNK
ncbi:putative methyltransferase-domain-containing protein [Corynascus similis CBS 632.67]